MSKGFKDSALAVLNAYREIAPERIKEDLEDTYPDITLQDALRIKTGMLDLFNCKTKEEQRQRERDYKALHAEMKRKYKTKSGKP